jgi:hypothetical protein
MKRFAAIILILFFAGCATANPTASSSSSKVSSQEAQSAMGEVVGSVTGKKTSEGDLRKLGQQMRHDKEAQSAVDSITGAMTDPSHQIKYCPIDGERYSAQLKVCPKHGVPLKNLDE